MTRLYAWTDVPNFGDALSGQIVEWVSGAPVTLVAVHHQRKLLAVGSVLQHAARNGDVIWGTGIHPHGYEDFWKNPTKAKLSLTVLAVRGPITRDVLLSRNIPCPSVYGDPAILLPRFHPRSSSPTDDVILLPHFNDYRYYATTPAATLGLRLVNPGWGWREVVDSITAARMVISTSLHGLIVAEAYGVPAIWFRPSHGEGFLKYQDYYGSTNRAANPVYDLRAALKMVPPPPPDYSPMCDRLLAAFDKRLIESICGAAPVRADSPGE